MSQLTTPFDVHDHRFGAGQPFTLGVEEEYMLMDADSFDLVQRAESVLEAETSGEYAELVSAELFESLVEFHTPVCATVADAGRELRRLRSHAVAAAGAQGLRLGSAGTHPFSLFERQRVTARDRYHALVDELQYAARRELIFGLHVHVAVDDADRAIRILGALGAHLAELVALSASSPFWRGAATGFESSRHLIFSAFPRSGPPPRFDSYDEYAAVIGRLVAAGCIEDYTRTWWDVRPHPRLGTLEVRVMDAVGRVDDAVALAAYVQSLVRRYAALDEAGATLTAQHPALVQEAKWRAARFGLGGTVVDPDGPGAIPVRALIERTLGELAPYARDLGCDAELDGVRRILLDGNGATAQRRAFAQRGDIGDVARAIDATTRVA